MPAATHGDGVSRIVPALVAGHAVESFGQDIDNFSFSFVAPLEADDSNILFHDNFMTTGDWAPRRYIRTLLQSPADPLARWERDGTD